MKCKKVINKEKFIVYECEEEKVAKIKEEVLECDVKGFEVINPKKDNIIFIAVDNCLITSKDNTKRCDFALQKDNKIYLVELKVDVKPKNRNEKLKEAIFQLKGCIKKFSNIEECFVCFEKEVAIKTSWENRKISFLEETKIPLEIKCKKEF